MPGPLPPRSTIPGTPASAGEPSRAREPASVELSIPDRLRKFEHTQNWHRERIDRLEDDVDRLRSAPPKMTTASVTTATVQETPYRGIDLGRYGQDTQTVILAAVDAALEGKRAKDALKTVEGFRGLRNDVVKALLIAFALGVGGLLVVLLVMEAAREFGGGHAAPATQHEFSHGGDHE
jgi:hypothetical protein